MENKVPLDRQLQAMSMDRNGEWSWFTVLYDIQDQVLQECIDKGLPHRFIYHKPYFDTFDPKYRKLHADIDAIVSRVGYKEFAMAVLKYQQHNLSQYQLQQSWK